MRREVRFVCCLKSDNFNSPVAIGWHKVQTTVDPIVLDVPAIQSTFVCKVLLELLIDVRGGRPPTLLRVDRVSKSRRVHHGQSQLDALLLYLHRFLLDPSGLLYALRNTRNHATFVEIAKEEAVYNSRLAKSSFSHHHQSEVEPSLHTLPVDLFRKGGEPDVVPILGRGRCIHFVNTHSLLVL